MPLPGTWSPIFRIYRGPSNHIIIGHWRKIYTEQKYSRIYLQNTAAGKGVGFYQSHPHAAEILTQILTCDVDIKICNMGRDLAPLPWLPFSNGFISSGVWRSCLPYLPIALPYSSRHGNLGSYL